MDKPWTNRGTPVYFHGTDVYCRGTAVFCRGLGYPEKREITGPKLWECLFEVEKGEKTTKWWCTKKRENKPSSPINRLCQNSCKINRLWKSRDNNVIGSSPEGSDLVATGPCLLPWLGQTPCGRGDAEIRSMSLGGTNVNDNMVKTVGSFVNCNLLQHFFPLSPLEMLEMHYIII